MCIVQTYRHKSAAIKIKPAGKHGVVQVDYFGLFTDAAAAELVQKAREECEKARVHVARFDRAVITCDVKAAAKDGFQGSHSIGAMVCRPDQYPEISAMCSALSAAGALRLVFLNYLDALEWSDRMAAGLARDESLSKRRCTPLIEERDRLLVVCQKDQPANQQTLSKQAGR